MRNVRSGSIANLGDLVDFVGGGTPRRDNPDFWGGPIAWASVKDLTGTDLESTAERITEEGLRNSATNLIGPGTVIVATRVGLGKVCVNRIPVAINQDLKALIPRNGAVLARFLLYFLLSQAELIERSGVGATVKGVTIPFLQNLKLFLPSLTEQEEIVRALDAAQELRGLRAEADCRTADLIPAIFYEMFGGFTKETREWDSVPISKVAQVQGGLQVTPQRQLYPLVRPYLRVANVQRGTLILDEIKEIGLTEDEYKRVLLQKYDLLLVEGNGSPEEIGRAAIWDGSIEGCVHQNHLIRVRCDLKVLAPEYLLIVLNTGAGKQYFKYSGNTTSGLVTISTSIVKRLKIPLPPIALQGQFAARVAEIRTLQAQQAASRQRLDDLFKSMLHRAFRGEL